MARNWDTERPKFLIFPSLFIIKQKQIRPAVVRTNVWIQWVCSITSTHIAGRTLHQGTTHILRFLWSVHLGKKGKPPSDYLKAVKLNIKGNVRRSGVILWTSGERNGGVTVKNNYCWQDKSSILALETVLRAYTKVNHKNTQNICHSRLEP
jgi:hypothetical protein